MNNNGQRIWDFMPKWASGEILLNQIYTTNTMKFKFEFKIPTVNRTFFQSPQQNINVPSFRIVDNFLTMYSQRTKSKSERRPVREHHNTVTSRFEKFKTICKKGRFSNSNFYDRSDWKPKNWRKIRSKIRRCKNVTMAVRSKSPLIYLMEKLKNVGKWVKMRGLLTN